MLVVTYLLVVMVACAATSARGGRFLPHPRDMTTVAKVAYFRSSIRHERQVVAWLRSRHAPRTLQRVSELHWYRAAAAWHTRLLARYQAKLAPHYTTEGAICSVFGQYCSQALTVARCESGLSVYAVNGQYLGLFQMGSSERATYGHGSDALTQARAAYAYFVASGRDWSPWECRP